MPSDEPPPFVRRFESPPGVASEPYAELFRRQQLESERHKLEAEGLRKRLELVDKELAERIAEGRRLLEEATARMSAELEAERQRGREREQELLDQVRRETEFSARQAADARQSWPARELELTRRLAALEAEWQAKWKDGVVGGEKNGVQIGVRNVTGGDEQKLLWLLLEVERVDEISVFGDDDTILVVGNLHYLRVRCAVAVGQIKGMEGIMTCVCKPDGETSRQLGVK